MLTELLLVATFKRKRANTPTRIESGGGLGVNVLYIYVLQYSASEDVAQLTFAQAMDQRQTSGHTKKNSVGDSEEDG